MSCVCILTPIVIAAWPAFSAAVVAAAASLGYEVAEAGLNSQQDKTEETSRQIRLEVPQSDIVTDQLGRDQRIVVRREAIEVTFSRDARGKASLCVSGRGYTDEQLQQLGEELSHRVVQQYVYQRLKNEMAVRQFVIIEEEVDAASAIRLKVRHWEQ